MPKSRFARRMMRAEILCAFGIRLRSEAMIGMKSFFEGESKSFRKKLSNGIGNFIGHGLGDYILERMCHVVPFDITVTVW